MLTDRDRVFELIETTSDLKFYNALVMNLLDTVKQLSEETKGVHGKPEVVALMCVPTANLAFYEGRFPNIVDAMLSELRFVQNDKRLSTGLSPKVLESFQDIEKDLRLTRNIKRFYSFAHDCCCLFIVQNIEARGIHQLMLNVSHLAGLSSHDDDFYKERTIQWMKRFSNNHKGYIGHVLAHAIDGLDKKDQQQMSKHVWEVVNVQSSTSNNTVD